MHESVNLLEFIMGCGILAMGFLLARYVKNSDDNNQKQWDKINEHSKEITTLKTEHDLFKQQDFLGCHWHSRREDDTK